MPAQRHFLDWSAPLADAVARWLLPDTPTGPPDFARRLILVPTRQAGRRLRQALARRCAAARTGALGLRVVSPAALLDTAEPPDAPPMLIRAVWARLLLDAPPDAFPDLLPPRQKNRSWLWALQTAELVQSLREQLAEADLDIASVPDRAGPLLAEPGRWRDLARLEARFLAELTALELGDPCTRQRALPDTAEPPESTDEIILAAVPDPPTLAIRLLDRLSARLRVSVLVHAPAAEHALFDDWGRPVPDAWSTRECPIPDWRDTLILAADPRDQADRILHELDTHAGQYGPGDTAIGAPDPAVAPALAEALEARRLRAFDPAEPPLARHPLYDLLALLRALAGRPDYPVLARFLRHAHVLDALAADPHISPARLLEELDSFQNVFLPRTLDDFTPDRLDGTAIVPDWRPVPFPALSAAVAFARRLRDSLHDHPPAEAVRQALAGLCANRALSDQNSADREWSAAATLIQNGLTELARTLTVRPELDREQALDLLLESLATRRVPRESPDADLDIEGWLELPWNEAPFLLVAGMNEGLVPDSRLGDVFLPDSLREQLGMRHDAQRAARDLFLLSTLLESRRAQGRLVLLCGRQTAAGDPLKPSRLLFHCPASELAARAAHLFAGPSDPPRRPHATLPFRLSPVPPDATPAWPPGKALNVTAFRAYLECPFRFYLDHVLGMAALDDLKTEPDALDFGLLIHHALQSLAKRPDLDACPDDPPIAEALHAAALRWMTARYGNRLTLTQQIALDAARNRLSAVAREQAALTRAGWRVLARETLFTLTLGSLPVRGRVDRVDYHPGNRLVRILDFKTTAKPNPCENVHLAAPRPDTPPYALLTRPNGKTRRWTDLQLPLYALMWEQAPLQPDCRLELGYFQVPASLEDTGVQTWPELDAETLASARACAEGVADAIRHGVFGPPAGRTAYTDPFRERFGGDLDAVFDLARFPGGTP